MSNKYKFQKHEDVYLTIIKYFEGDILLVKDNIIKDLDFLRLNEEFGRCPSVSIDNAVMERTKIGSVVPLDASWSDIGSLKSLWEYEDKNAQGNLIQGNVLLKNVERSFFRSENRLLVGLGVQDLIALETDDATLIANKEKKEIRFRLKSINFLKDP